MLIYNFPTNNFDLIQKYIPYKIVKYKKDSKYYIMINVFIDYSNIFGGSLYFIIDEKFNKDYEGNEIYEFISELEESYDGSESSNDIMKKLLRGSENLQLGVDYFVAAEVNENESEISFIDTECVMSTNINDYADLSYLKIKDIENINYFIYNNTVDYTFTSDELDSLNSTFMHIIQTDSELYSNVVLPIDFVYKNVIDYYANGQYDEAIILMNSIFNTQLTIVSNVSTCGCGTQSNCVSNNSTTNAINTGTDLVSLDTATCIDKYKAAIFEWLMKMLSDVSFYCNWMFNELSDDGIKMPNEELIDKLIRLLEEFLASGYDLSNLNGCKKACGCGHNKSYSNDKLNMLSGNCSDLSGEINSNADNCSNASIINNYIKVLNWVKHNEIDENKNKIYIYGKQFAEIFPLLSF